MTNDSSKTRKTFDIITPIAEADVIFDLCKLKSHSLTKLSAAAKNFYGCIPGITKFELHSAYPDIEDFTSMLCDLGHMLCEEKNVIAITDGIVGMEGEGPTGGSPKKMDVLLVSDNPYASDAVASEILGIGADGVPLVAEARARGYFSPDELTVIGEKTDDVKVTDFVLPRSQNIPGLSFFSHGAMGRFFMPRPQITDKCRACGECVRSCPQKTISIKNKRAHINRKNCIRCFCCQELCPFVAIKTKRNPIITLISKIR